VNHAKLIFILILLTSMVMGMTGAREFGNIVAQHLAAQQAAHKQ
jgi:hypothetical protein